MRFAQASNLLLCLAAALIFLLSVGVFSGAEKQRAHTYKTGKLEKNERNSRHHACTHDSVSSRRRTGLVEAALW